jgi:hypothetical protein
MPNDAFAAYDFLDTFAKNVAQDIPVQRYEMIYRLELDHQKLILQSIIGIGFCGMLIIVALSL